MLDILLFASSIYLNLPKRELDCTIGGGLKTDLSGLYFWYPLNSPPGKSKEETRQYYSYI